MKKTLALIMAIVLAVTVCVIPTLANATKLEVAANENVTLPSRAHSENADTIKDPKILAKIDALEAELNELEDSIMKQAHTSLKAINISEIDRKAILQNCKNIIKEGSSEILSSYGFEPAGLNKDSSDILTRSESNSVVITDELLYDSAEGLYRFQGDWDTVDGSNNGWDMFTDIEDIAGVRMTNTTNYHVYKSFCKTWDNIGTQTGYVNSSGQHEPVDSRCTKRMEDIAGVAYNIIDTYWNGAGWISYRTDTGRITQYIKKNPGAKTNKIFLDINHNYKHFIWNGAASISSVGFGGLSNALSIVYSSANGQWQRSGGGRTIS